MKPVPGETLRWILGTVSTRTCVSSAYPVGTLITTITNRISLAITSDLKERLSKEAEDGIS
mgnify:CR=1 FL=1